MFRKVTFFVLSISFANLCAASNDAEFVYEKPLNSIDLAIHAKLQDFGVVESAVEFINEQFILAESLTLIIGSDDGPLFDPSSNEIIIPYGFVDEVKTRFSDANYIETGVSNDDATKDALMHTLFHEFAHAMIYMHDIPVLGKEEDAADALATVLLIEFFENGQEIALSAADLFDLESEDRDELTDEDFWDEHSLDDQRYFSTLCHIYGSDPKAYADLLAQADISQDRSELCVEEYQQLLRSWLKLLEPHMNKET